MTLTTIILLLSIGQSLPNTAEVALSLRSAKDTDQLFDYELSVGGEWTNLEIETSYERENGIDYFNYSLTGGNEFIGDVYFEYETRIHDAAGIDRQKLAMMYRAGSYSLGGGIVTSRYETPVNAVYSVKSSIPYGKAEFSTNLGSIHIWKVSLKKTFEGGFFVRGNLNSDNGNMFYKLKFGVKWKF